MKARGLRAGLEYKWGALSCTSIGALLASINGGSLIVALPTLLRELHTGLFSLVWVLLSYLLAQTALTLTAGRIADVVGRKRLYVGGFALFTAVSLLAGFVGGAGQLIAARTLMGAAGAFMMATSSVIVTDAFPSRELGRALGINMMMAAAGSTLGVVVGGVMTSISWRWVFWFNVPLGVVGTAWAAANLREVVELEKGRRLDVAGNLAFLGGLAGLLVALTLGGIRGWGSPLVAAGFGAAALLFPLFLLVEARAKDPMVRLSTFRSRTFAFGNLSAFLNSVARFAVMFMFVFFFIGVRGYDHLMAGLLLVPLAGVMFVAAPVSGWLADRGEARVISTAGMLVTAAGLLGMGTLVGAGTPYREIALLMAVVGAGSGIFNSPNTRSIMSSVGPGERGVASGTRTLLTNVGGVLSIALAISIVAGAIPQREMFEIFSGTTGHPLSPEEAGPFVSGFHRALLVGAAASLLGALFSALRGRT
ncbi:major facilitator superfamily MFS_1 [Rubrobacter xylanophilus DSM 9941]|uniref:Major facilitator superfamily MFS_1 n=1 Tax=Rubrobacter xylanophilus (strain DSM 9941 / JCM 11954 / NBRC 16129 / PRD-1) TaxID=266117 RepID=Q1AYE0_RUBXD|nr:MFS transporter [Rubrobacter xylanophilus]ABG03588.1 major facilitator superfamily MFS_1 [Rubrobacter xylanophilus DSM 9941]